MRIAAFFSDKLHKLSPDWKNRIDADRLVSGMIADATNGKPACYNGHPSVYRNKSNIYAIYDIVVKLLIL